jgi:cysteinyl-tRNA synthetase, unknown class
MSLNRRTLLGRAGAILACLLMPSLFMPSLVTPMSAAAATGKSGKAAKTATADPARAVRRKLLADVQTWGYQLRLLNFAELAAAPIDLLITDHGFSDGRQFIRQFEPREVANLKTKPDGSRRLVVAYLSIGEAEQYRFYWNEAWFNPATKPSWLGQMNPRWFGNFPVDFWQPEWQRLMVGGPDAYLDRILAQGFDGIYLDRADVFQETLQRHPQGARTMAQFIAQLAAAGRAKNPEFLVILQNAEELIAERPVREAIDAIAKEDLYYGLDFSENANSRDAVAYAERDLLRAQAAGKRIFVVEYVGDAEAQRRVIDRSKARGFLPYFGPRDLRSLTIDPRTLAPDYAGPLVPQERATRGP